MKEEYVDTGRRKTAVASVRLRSGSGKVNVNGKELEAYFPLEIQRKRAFEPLQRAEVEGQFDMIIRIKGGGIEGQVEAVRLGLARALVRYNEKLRPNFKDLGLLTRDSRMKERKKYGKAGARKSFQFSKR